MKCEYIEIIEDKTGILPKMINYGSIANGVILNTNNMIFEPTRNKDRVALYTTKLKILNVPFAVIKADIELSNPARYMRATIIVVEDSTKIVSIKKEKNELQILN